MGFVILHLGLTAFTFQFWRKSRRWDWRFGKAALTGLMLYQAVALAISVVRFFKAGG